MVAETIVGSQPNLGSKSLPPPRTNLGAMEAQQTCTMMQEEGNFARAAGLIQLGWACGQRLWAYYTYKRRIQKSIWEGLKATIY